MPAYYHAQDPAQYAQFQQSRKDQQFQNMLRMMMQLQALKQDRSQWEQSMGLKQQQQALDVEQFKSLDRYRKAQEKYNEYLMKPKPPTPSATMKTIEYMVGMGIAPDRKTAFNMYKGLKDPERIRLEAQARAEGTAAGKGTTTTPTTFDRKKSALDKKVQEGAITQQQADQALLGIKPPVSESEKIRKGYPTRDANLRFASSAHEGAILKDMRKQIKGAEGAFPTVDGVRVDMPTKYGAAMMNVEDRVATPEDKQIIRKYDAMFQAFVNMVLPNYKSFKEFAQSSGRGKDWDMKQVKLWFDIYK